MQIHGPIKVVDGITVTTYGSTGSIAELISALAEVRRLRAVDAALQPPARYEMPLRLVGGEA